MKGSIVFFLAACAFTQALPTPGQFTTLEEIDNRIISGWPATLGQFPHQVHLRMITTSGGLNACGGIVIHPQWILTAAHCMVDKTAVFVRYATTNVTEPGLILESTNFIVHPSYNPSNLNHDIALINVGRWVEPSDNIKSIRMPGRDALNVTYDGVQSTVSGYGRTDNTGPASETLNFVNLRIISNAACGAVYGIIIDSTICAVGLLNTAESTCNGDSGGPLIVYEEDGEPTLIGVVSFVSSAGCDADYPSGYVRPQFYHDWMTEVTGIEF